MWVYLFDCKIDSYRSLCLQKIVPTLLFEERIFIAKEFIDEFVNLLLHASLENLYK